MHKDLTSDQTNNLQNVSPCVFIVINLDSTYVLATNPVVRTAAFYFGVLHCAVSLLHSNTLEECRLHLRGDWPHQSGYEVMRRKAWDNGQSQLQRWGKRDRTCPEPMGVEALKRNLLTLILRRFRMGTVWFYTSTSNKRAARPKLYTKSLTRDLKLMYSRLTVVRISINL